MAAIGVARTNTIERFYDKFGRSLGYALNGTRQSTLAYDLSTGRLLTMEIFSHGESEARSDLSANLHESTLTGIRANPEGFGGRPNGGVWVAGLCEEGAFGR